MLRMTGLLILLAMSYSNLAWAHDDIQLEQFWINEAPPVSRVHAAYLEIQNNTGEKLTLSSIESDELFPTVLSGINYECKRSKPFHQPFSIASRMTERSRRERIEPRP